MKNLIIYGLLTGMSLFGNSCSKDFLEQSNPNTESSDSYWHETKNYYDGLSAAYSSWRLNGMFGRWYHVLMVSRSDEGYSQSPNPYFQAYSNFNISSYNDNNAEAIIQAWQDIYRNIFYSNQVLDNMATTGYSLFANSEDADKIVAQAYFIRGFSYWYLAGSYGKGPLMLHATGNGPIGLQEDIYKQALADFKEAEKGLPPFWGGNDLGRVTLGAAKAMIAKVDFQLAGFYNRPGKDASLATPYWEEAQGKIEEILGMGYQLHVATTRTQDGLSDSIDYQASYKQNFTSELQIPNTENNNESIFEIQFKEGTFNGSETGMQRSKFFGLVVDGGAWDDASASGWLVSEFQKETTKDGEDDPRLSATLFYKKSNDSFIYYGKTWDQWVEAGFKLNRPAYWRKYTRVDYPGIKGEDYSSGINFRVIRLSDIYLMYAEVLNELNGNRAVAVEYLNKVRRRVNMADLNPANFTSKTVLLQQIQHERLVELCGEGYRWFDLERWGILFDQGQINQIANERDPEFTNFKMGVSNLFPIPNRERALYPGLTQNNGY
jgi:starch-binding outer membrane protein, SusD/RagB family